MRLSRRQAARINRIAVGMLLGFYLAFIIYAFLADTAPYDYWLVLKGAREYCTSDTFQFGPVSSYYYPAPFYILLCLPALYAEPLLRFLFVLMPVILAVRISRWHPLSLLYPPLISMITLGQNSWMLLPLFVAAQTAETDKKVEWWYGLVFVLASFKPHPALPAVLWLMTKWWKQPSVWLTAILGWLLLAVPAFILYPNWIIDWVTHLGPTRPQVTTLALLPVHSGFHDNRLVVLLFCTIAGVILYSILKWRRKELIFYDWVLIYFFCSPFIIYYDLYLLLPFIVTHRRRFYLAMTAGIVALLYAMMTGGLWEMCVVITMALVFERVIRNE